METDRATSQKAPWALAKETYRGLEELKLQERSPSGQTF